MIKVVEERLCDTIKVPRKILDENLIETIHNYANKAGISVIIEKDKIKVGSGLFGEAEPCIVVYNKNFRSKYYNYAIVQRQQGNNASISVYLGGNSENYAKKVYAEDAKKKGMFVGNLMGPNPKKQQAEYDYYDIVKRVISETIYSLGVTQANNVYHTTSYNDTDNTAKKANQTNNVHTNTYEDTNTNYTAKEANQENNTYHTASYENTNNITEELDQIENNFKNKNNATENKDDSSGSFWVLVLIIVAGVLGYNYLGGIGGAFAGYVILLVIGYIISKLGKKE